MSARSVDRRAYRLVARRDFVERARDKSFVISTAVTLVILMGIILATALFNRGGSYDLGVVGEGSRGPADLAARVAATQGVTVRVLTYADASAADAALRDDAVDLVLVDGEQLRVRSRPPAQLVSLLQAAAQLGRLRGALEGAGIEPEEVARLLAPEPLPIVALEPVAPARQRDTTVAFVATLLLYGQLFGYGVWVATGVVEEKSSRVVELLLSSVHPSQLLLGKVVGLGLLGLFQLSIIGAVGMTAARLAGVLTFPSGALPTIGLVLFWFLLGFGFYSTLFAVAGSLVSRQEELQNALLPLQLLVLGSFVISLSAIREPASTLARVASVLPPTAPLAMPPRLVQGEADLSQAALAVALSLAATTLLVPLAARIYSGAILRVGARVRLREAWRAERVSRPAAG